MRGALQSSISFLVVVGFIAPFFYAINKTRDAFAFLLKVPKCEIFDRSDFHDFYSIKPFWVGDFGAKI